MATTPSRMVNGIRQNAQSAFNLNNGTSAGSIMGTIDPTSGELNPTGFGVGGNKIRGYVNRVQRGIDDVRVRGKEPLTEFSGQGASALTPPKDDKRAMSALLPGVDRPGTLNVMQLSKPNTPPSVGATPTNGPMQDIYSQTLAELQNIIKNPNAGRREITTALGSTYSVVDKPKLESLQAIISSLGERFKTEQTGKLGATQADIARERNRLTGLGIDEKARSRLSEDISKEQTNKLREESIFQEKLKLFSPAAGGSTVNANAGLFRMALSGESIPSGYKARADKLVKDFNEKYKEYLRSNEIQDTPDIRQAYITKFENTLI